MVANADAPAPVTVATLNTRGIPLAGTRLAERYASIAESFEACGVDAVNFQEVFTYYHLRLLTRRMPSYRHASFRPSAAGPAGGLVTLSRLPSPDPPTSASESAWTSRACPGSPGSWHR